MSKDYEGQALILWRDSFGYKDLASLLCRIDELEAEDKKSKIAWMWAEMLEAKVRELEDQLKEHETLGLQVYGRKIRVLNDRVKELEAENARLKTIYSMGTGVVKEVEDNGDTKQS